MLNNRENKKKFSDDSCSDHNMWLNCHDKFRVSTEMKLDRHNCFQKSKK